MTDSLRIRDWEQMVKTIRQLIELVKRTSPKRFMGFLGRCIPETFDPPRANSIRSTLPVNRVDSQEGTLGSAQVATQRRETKRPIMIVFKNSKNFPSTASVSRAKT